MSLGEEDSVICAAGPFVRNKRCALVATLPERAILKTNHVVTRGHLDARSHVVGPVDVPDRARFDVLVVGVARLIDSTPRVRVLPRYSVW